MGSFHRFDTQARAIDNRSTTAMCPRIKGKLSRSTHLSMVAATALSQEVELAWSTELGLWRRWLARSGQFHGPVRHERTCVGGGRAAAEPAGLRWDGTRSRFTVRCVGPPHSHGRRVGHRPLVPVESARRCLH